MWGVQRRAQATGGFFSASCVCVIAQCAHTCVYVCVCVSDAQPSSPPLKVPFIPHTPAILLWSWEDGEEHPVWTREAESQTQIRILSLGAPSSGPSLAALEASR